MSCPIKPLSMVACLFIPIAVSGLGGSLSWAAATSAPAAGQPAASPPATKPSTPPPASAEQNGGGEGDQTKEQVIGDEASATRNAARTRMRECGHQWSSMKKSGAAAGLTWKEFSQGCLARK